MKKSVLITGVAGMIGSHLAESLLAAGYSVLGMDDLSYGHAGNLAAALRNPAFEFREATILDVPLLRELAKGQQAIIHLAAVKKISEKDVGLPTLLVNTKGTENVLEVARETGCKVLFASTSDVYGMSPDLPLREDGDLLLGPSMIKRWSYAVSKLYGEQLAFAYHHDHGVPVVVIRYFGGFSPRSSFAWSGGHVPIFIRAILNNEEVIVHGDGLQTRSMGFVSDLVDGTVLALEAEEAVGEIINIGNDEELSVLETARLIHRVSKVPHELKVRFVPMSEVFGKYKDIQRRIPDLAKAGRILGYRPRVRLEDAIRLTIDEVRKSQPARG